MNKKYDKVTCLESYRKDIDEGSSSDMPDAQKDIYDALVELRATVDNFNKLPKIAFRDGVYKGLNPEAVYTTTVGGFCFGYKLKMSLISDVMTRTVFIKCIDQRVDEVPAEEISPIMMAVFDAILEKEDSVPQITQIGRHALMVQQEFIPMHLVELNPNIVVPNG